MLTSGVFAAFAVAVCQYAELLGLHRLLSFRMELDGWDAAVIGITTTVLVLSSAGLICLTLEWRSTPQTAGEPRDRLPTTPQKEVSSMWSIFARFVGAFRVSDAAAEALVAIGRRS